MTTFRKGDIVALVTTEVETADAFGVKLVDGFWFHPERLTLVERPPREVTVTLTEEQITYLRILAAENFEHPKYVDGAYATLADIEDTFRD